MGHQGSDVVDVPLRLQSVVNSWAFKGKLKNTYTAAFYSFPHFREAKVVSVAARLVDFLYVAYSGWVLCIGERSASFNQATACREAIHGIIVLRLADHLDAVCVVVCHLRIRLHLRKDVNAAVNYAHRADLEWDNGVGT